MAHFTPADFPTLGSAGHLLALANQQKERLLDAALVNEQVTAAQFKVVMLIGKGWADTPAELCRRLNLDSGSMTRMLDRLQNKDLIERRPCEQDRRSIRLALTAAGSALFGRLPEIGSTAMNHLFGNLDDAELATLEGLLRKMLEGAEGLSCPLVEERHP